MQLCKLHKHASELEQSGGGRGRAEAEGLRGGQRWVEKGKGGHTMTLPLQKAWDHAIDLTPGTELPCSQMFPLSPAEQKELDDFLWENLVNGVSGIMITG